MGRPCSVDLRERAVAASNKIGVAAAAATFSVGQASIKRWRRQLRIHGVLAPRPMGGDRRSGAVTVQAVVEAVQEEPDRTLHELCKWFLERKGRSVQASTLSAALRRAGYRRRAKVVLATERLKAKWAEVRIAYREQMLTFDQKDLIFIDESGVQRGMHRPTAWRQPGAVVVGRAVRSRGTVTTVIGALSIDGIVATLYGEGATTAEVFRAFVVRCLVPVLRPGHIVVMDNLGAHKAKGIRELIEAAGAKVVFLPPYSPELNPIECAWSKVKTLLRTVAAETLPKLHHALEAALDALTGRDAEEWFRHTGYVTAA